MADLIVVLRLETSKASPGLEQNNLTKRLFLDGLLSINILNYFNTHNFSLYILDINYCVL